MSENELEICEDQSLLIELEEAELNKVIGFYGLYVGLPSDPLKAAKQWRNLRQRARRHGYTVLKQVAVDYIKGFINSRGIKRDKSVPVLVIELKCGGKATYQTFGDIPDHDVPCPCGDPKHYLIKYQDLRAK